MDEAVLELSENAIPTLSKVQKKLVSLEFDPIIFLNHPFLEDLVELILSDDTLNPTIIDALIKHVISILIHGELTFIFAKGKIIIVREFPGEDEYFTIRFYLEADKNRASPSGKIRLKNFNDDDSVTNEIIYPRMAAKIRFDNLKTILETVCDTNLDENLKFATLGAIYCYLE